MATGKLRTLVSWNVNGVRAAVKKGFLDWLANSGYDQVHIQETKISTPEQIVANLLKPQNYQSYWDFATEKKGYSGVASFAHNSFLPLEVKTKFPAAILSGEGRLVELVYPHFHLFNLYFPNGGSGPMRLAYKLEFYDAFLKYINKLQQVGKSVIFCGDVNTAHAEIDLTRAKESQNVSGFLPEERAWVSKFIEAGLVDTFRHLHPGETGHYTWWDQKTRARERNVGWRIDYFFISADLLPRLKEAFILPEVLGSDHCPIGIKIEL